VLLAGVKDEDPMVRVRALSSLAHREGEGASAALHDAMHDNDKAVRITAVDNAGNDESILQQALTDSDATVRELAKARINGLEKKEVTF
jgi:HEAT repeat protein